MDWTDIVHQHGRACGFRKTSPPWWTCGLPAGHSGDHAAIQVLPFA